MWYVGIRSKILAHAFNHSVQDLKGNKSESLELNRINELLGSAVWFYFSRSKVQVCKKSAKGF